METISIDTYQFDELPKEVQEKVVDKTRDTFKIDSDLITEIFKEELANKGLPNEDIRYSLSYCQGDGVAFYGNIDIDLLCEKDEKAKDLIEAIRKFDPDVYLAITIKKSSHFHMYDHYNTMDLYIEDDFHWASEEEEKKFIRRLTELEKYLKDLIKDTSQELERIGYADIESQLSDENIIDFLTANECRFTFDGENKIYL